MKTKEMAEAALRALNQKDFIDRRLSLHFAKELGQSHKSPKSPKEPRSVVTHNGYQLLMLL